MGRTRRRRGGGGLGGGGLVCGDEVARGKRTGVGVSYPGGHVQPVFEAGLMERILWSWSDGRIACLAQ